MLIIRLGCKPSEYENKQDFFSCLQISRILLPPEKIVKINKTEKKISGNYAMKKEKLQSLESDLLDKTFSDSF